MEGSFNQSLKSPAMFAKSFCDKFPVSVNRLKKLSPYKTGRPALILRRTGGGKLRVKPLPDKRVETNFGKHIFRHELIVEVSIKRGIEKIKNLPGRLLVGVGFALFFNITVDIFEHFNGFCQCLVGFGQLIILFYEDCLVAL